MSLKCLPKFTKSRANQKYEKNQSIVHLIRSHYSHGHRKKHGEIKVKEKQFKCLLMRGKG